MSEVNEVSEVAANGTNAEKVLERMLTPAKHHGRADSDVHWDDEAMRDMYGLATKTPETMASYFWTLRHHTVRAHDMLAALKMMARAIGSGEELDDKEAIGAVASEAYESVFRLREMLDDFTDELCVRKEPAAHGSAAQALNAAVAS